MWKKIERQRESEGMRDKNRWMLKRNRREEGIKSLFVEREREVRSTIMDTKKNKNERKQEMQSRREEEK